jgi:hypothetical protein
MREMPAPFAFDILGPGKRIKFLSRGEGFSAVVGEESRKKKGKIYRERIFNQISCVYRTKLFSLPGLLMIIELSSAGRLFPPPRAPVPPICVRRARRSSEEM